MTPDDDPIHIQGEIPAGLEHSPFINLDLAPIPAGRRTWSTFHIAALWIATCATIPTFLLASSLIYRGMSGAQAIVAIFLGSLLGLVPILMNSDAGARYGISFPVLARSAFGIRGSNVVGLVRALVGCGWFGIQSWLAGESFNTLLSALVPGWAQGWDGVWLGFILVLVLSLFFILAGMESTKHLLAWAAPFLVVVGIGLLYWIQSQSHGLGPLLSRRSRLPGEGSFWLLFIPSLSLTCSAWAALALNISDFTRFVGRQRDQVVGQALGLPITMALFSFLGLGVASATAAMFGRVMWNPVDLLAHSRNPAVVILALLFVVVATVTTNVAVHLVGAANALSNLWCRGISFRVGGLIAGVLGFLVQPWKILADPGRALISGLGWYSALLGPAIGILIADYYIVRRRRLDVPALYREGGMYWHRGGLNYAGLLALLLGIALSLVGVSARPLRILYDHSWFTGFFSGLVFYPIVAAAMGIGPPRVPEDAP